VFENIIAQEGVVEELKTGLARGDLPPALLFHGPDYSGKLSTALELARVTGCSAPNPADRGGWNCPCRDCEQHRTLHHPYTLTLGGRYFAAEIEASRRAFVESPRRSTAYLFVRSLRKLLRRFDGVFWEGRETGFKQAAAGLAEVEEGLGIFYPPSLSRGGEAGENYRELIKTHGALLDRIAAAARDAASLRACDNISIDQVRRISSWVQLSSGDFKTIILENADSMLIPAQNALLKILEDPPAGCRFILLTPRRRRILPTILSRLRPLRFAERTGAQGREITDRIFHHPWEGSLKDFFLSASSGFSLETFRKASGDFVEDFLNRRSPDRGTLSFLAEKNQKENRRLFKIFLTQVEEELYRRFPPPQPAWVYQVLVKAGACLREALSQEELANQNPLLLAEGLGYDLRSLCRELSSGTGLN
jgi:DNA polymerase III delta prime subunit